MLDSLRRIQPSASPGTKTWTPEQGYENLELSSRVEVVAGEADPYCAGLARSAKAAILTSDSDMFMYDLGFHGSVIMLGTLGVTRLETSIDSQGGSVTLMHAQQLRPYTIARQMLHPAPGKEITSLQRYGFERSISSSAPAGVIRDRAEHRSLSSAEQSRFVQFCWHYDRGPFERKPPISELQSLDPRISEVYWQFRDADRFLSNEWAGPNVYLPVLFEDPTRESSWNYGRDFRVLAYSLLASSTTTEARLPVSVFEHCRRGVKISAVPIELNDTMKRVQAGLLDTSLPHERKYADNALHHWWAFAAQMVVGVKQQDGKFLPDRKHLARLLSSGCVNGRVSWDDISFIANLQAVLYSLWILKQISSIVLIEGKPGALIDTLRRLLQDLPPLTQVMDGPWAMPGADANELRSLFSKVLEGVSKVKTATFTTLRFLRQNHEVRLGPVVKSQLELAKEARTKRNMFECLDEG